MPRALKLALLCAAGFGFAMGKLDADVKIRDAIRAQNLRLAQLNARTLVDEFESRKLGVAVKSDAAS